MEEVDSHSLWQKEEDYKRKEALTVNNEHVNRSSLSIEKLDQCEKKIIIGYSNTSFSSISQANIFLK